MLASACLYGLITRQRSHAQRMCKVCSHGAAARPAPALESRTFMLMLLVQVPGLHEQGVPAVRQQSQQALQAQ